ncbi:Trm5-related predicted tRNA methylase [Microbacterium terrae]|nr:hypothetical protein [Microbacterium terrae]MBP1078102.1 Trm5-related predicted tRNA methylase [Microbacterium terrae]GLK00271.1 hypothetical protein GCM10017594_34680 [Microbacterium terrae]
MTTLPLRRGLAAVAVALLVGLGTAACTASPTAGESAADVHEDQPGDEGQSTADACALVQSTVEEATAEFESLDPTDPAAIVDAMSSAAQELTQIASQVTNDEVAAVLPDLQTMFVEVGDVMQAIVDGDASKLTDLAELGTTFQETAERFAEVCTS